MLEAMSCGCVVVGSDTEPVREVIEDGVNGILTDFNSPREIADKAIGALTYPSLMESVRKKARETIEKKYALSDLLPRHLGYIMNRGNGANGGVKSNGPFG
jgi:glycosyltransferase involved in cell wall biosynthesis